MTERRQTMGDILENHARYSLERLHKELKWLFQQKRDQLIEDFKEDWEQNVEQHIENTLNDIGLDVRRSFEALEPKVKIDYIIRWFDENKDKND